MFIAFDLDGTLADPSEGVTNGINYTLNALGHPQRKKEELLHYIGPPTEWIFADVLQTDDPVLVEKARKIFTEFYRTTGYAQNHLYAQSVSIIETLKNAGHYLVVVTSKSESGAQAAAEHFQLATHFEGIFGRVNDCSKKDSLKQALASSSIRPALMIGDRKFDIDAGNALDCTTIGVTYGFGSREELTMAGADKIVDSQTRLLQTVLRIAKSA